MQVVWEEIAGTARAKWLLWTGKRIDAQTALQWGVVNEIVPRAGRRCGHRDRARPRREAGLYRTLQKQTLNANLRRRIIQGFPSVRRSKVSRPPTCLIRTGLRGTPPEVRMGNRDIDIHGMDDGSRTPV